MRKGSPRCVSGKYFRIPFCQAPHNSPGSRSSAAFSWGARFDRRAKADLYSLGFSLKLGVPATNSVPLSPLSLVVAQTSGLWFFNVLITVGKPTFLRKCDQKGVLHWRALIAFSRKTISALDAVRTEEAVGLLTTELALFLWQRPQKTPSGCPTGLRPCQAASGPPGGMV